MWDVQNNRCLQHVSKRLCVYVWLSLLPRKVCVKDDGLCSYGQVFGGTFSIPVPAALSLRAFDPFTFILLYLDNGTYV